MGVHGLWRLIEPSGRPIRLEALENKRLAVDVSIWLHQAVKGFQDNKGAPIPNAHLLGIYHRICKLLYFRIKPVFVFDGGVPVLKKQTIAKRNQLKSRNLNEADRIHRTLLDTLLKHTAISKVLSEKTKAAITTTSSPPKKSSFHQNTTSEKDEANLYFLPPTSSFDTSFTNSDDENNDEEISENDEDSNSQKRWDLHSIETESAEFKALPLEMRHEILTDLKETRKQSSWGRINELPTESDDFSIYQMKRLLKRQSVQTALEDAEKEMGGHSLSLGELEKLLNDQGVITGNSVGNRIASDENTRFVLIKDVKQAIEEAKQREIKEINKQQEKEEVIKEKELEKDEETVDNKIKNKGEEEYEDDLKKAIALSLQEVPSTSKEFNSEDRKIIEDKLELSFFEDLLSDSSDEEQISQIVSKMTSAQNYMMEYSGLTPTEIARIIASKSKKPQKRKLATISEEEEPAKAEKKKEKFPDSEEISNKPVEEETEKVANEQLDSDSSSDDFVEVEAAAKEKAETNNKTETLNMEIVIQPNQDLDDDLFKDVFNKTPDQQIISDKEEPVQITEIEPTKIINQVADNEVNEIINDEEQRNDDEKVDEGKIVINNRAKTGESLKEKIEKMIKQYSKPSLSQKVVKVIDKSQDNESDEKPQIGVEKPVLSTAQMNEIKDNLRKEQMELAAQRSTKERLATNITDQMYQETQELLELFGIPYVIAPMEAEAQCAFLDEIQLTDGTITDDSDIWLFGGRTVYRNFFNAGKQVMEFHLEHIQHNFKLTREQMILLALLVGSDYTMGLSGVGPVTALEILAAFPPKTTEITVSRSELLTGLAEFRQWVVKGKLPGPGRTGLRNKIKNVLIHDGFPNLQVIQAYLEPKVESSHEKFSWGKPDVVGLVDFAKRKFGWTEHKSQEILKPVLKRIEDKRIQTSIKDYFDSQVKELNMTDAGNKMSKRVKTALNKIGKPIGEIEQEEEEKGEKKARSSKGKRVAKRKTKSDKEDGTGFEDPATKPAAKKRRKRKETGSKNDEEAKGEIDEDIAVLKEVEVRSKRKVEEISEDAQRELNQMAQTKKEALHRKEVIPQKEREKIDVLRNKMKAIEVFRKSKQGPGFVKKKGRARREPKAEAELSESSSDD